VTRLGAGRPGARQRYFSSPPRLDRLCGPSSLLFSGYRGFFRSRDSSVGIALGYGLDDRGSRVRFPAGAGNFSLHHRVQTGSGAHAASYPVGTRGSFPGVKRPGHEADHLPPSSAEIKE
jgi:hypothetical protein